MPVPHDVYILKVTLRCSCLFNTFTLFMILNGRFACLCEYRMQKVWVKHNVYHDSSKMKSGHIKFFGGCLLYEIKFGKKNKQKNHFLSNDFCTCKQFCYVLSVTMSSCVEDLRQKSFLFVAVNKRPHAALKRPKNAHVSWEMWSFHCDSRLPQGLPSTDVTDTPHENCAVLTRRLLFLCCSLWSSLGHMSGSLFLISFSSRRPTGPGLDFLFGKDFPSLQLKNISENPAITRKQKYCGKLLRQNCCAVLTLFTCGPSHAHCSFLLISHTV